MELGGLQSVGSQRVKHDWSNIAQQRSVMQLSPLSSSRTFHHFIKKSGTREAVSPNCPFPPALGSHKSTLCLYRLACSAYFIEMESYNMCSFVSGVFHLACLFSSQCFIPFDGGIIFCCINVPHFVYSSFSWWTPEMSPSFGYYD